MNQRFFEIHLIVIGLHMSFLHLTSDNMLRLMPPPAVAGDYVIFFSKLSPGDFGWTGPP